MSRRVRYLMQDLGAWARQLGGVALQQRPGQGQDHLARQQRQQDQRLVQRLHPPRMDLRVDQVMDETPSTRTLRLTRTDGELPPFSPGQYVNLFVELQGVRTSRPYSISSAPGEAHLDLTVRRAPGGFVSPHLLDEVRPGDLLQSSGPAGCFRHEPLIDGDELVLLAGGSGITPMMSMLRDQQRRGFPLGVALLYGCRSEQDVIFGEELGRLAEQHERFHYQLVISEPGDGYSGASGLLDAERIGPLVGEPGARTFLLCGPNPMLALCGEALRQLGVPRHKVRTETFGVPDDITSQPGWPQGLAADKRFTVALEGHAPVQARAGEPLMSSLERAGVVAPALCRTGACSACRTRLLQGQVFMPPHTGLRQSDRRAGYLHICVAYPISDLELRLYGATWIE